MGKRFHADCGAALRSARCVRPPVNRHRAIPGGERLTPPRGPSRHRFEAGLPRRAGRTPGAAAGPAAIENRPREAPPGTRRALTPCRTGPSVPGSRKIITFPVNTMRSNRSSRQVPMSARSAMIHASCGAFVRAAASIPASASTPTTEKPRTATSIGRVQFHSRRQARGFGPTREVMFRSSRLHHECPGPRPPASATVRRSLRRGAHRCPATGCSPKPLFQRGSPAVGPVGAHPSCPRLCRIRWDSAVRTFPGPAQHIPVDDLPSPPAVEGLKGGYEGALR